MNTRSNGVEKGHHNGWTIYKHEGTPGLADPHLPFWFATNGERRISNLTKSGIVAMIDALDTTDAAHRDAVAAMLLG